jgi:hypothetical protein
MKTEYLLRRSGRTQYGDEGTPRGLVPTKHDQQMWQHHRQLHEELVTRFGLNKLGVPKHEIDTERKSCVHEQLNINV